MRAQVLTPARMLSVAFLLAMSMTASADTDSALVFGDRVARSRYEYVVKRSATFREMMAVIERAPGLVVTIRAVPRLHDAASQLARATLRVEDGRLHAVVEFAATSIEPRAQVELLAHELAHVVEAVCLMRLGVREDLQGELLARGFATRQPRSRRPGVETRFALEVGRLVAAELVSVRHGAGRLRALAQRHRLGSACVDL